MIFGQCLPLFLHLQLKYNLESDEPMKPLRLIDLGYQNGDITKEERDGLRYWYRCKF